MKAIKINLRRLRFLAVFYRSMHAPYRASARAQTAYYQGRLDDSAWRNAGRLRRFTGARPDSVLEKYIPGEPTVIIEHKQGAAGRTAINYIYSGAKPDGLMIGAVGNVLVSGPILAWRAVTTIWTSSSMLAPRKAAVPPPSSPERKLGSTASRSSRCDGLRIGANSVGHITSINGRLAAYLLGLKEPKFVVGYSSPERDVALLQGEIDGGSMSSATIQQNPSLAEKVHFHTVITVPKGRYIAPYSRATPEIDSFAKSEKEHRLLSLYRAFDYPRWPYILPPGTPKELVNILRDAMAKSFKDAGFAKEFKTLTGVDPSPITAESIEAAIKDVPRDAETIALYKHLADPRPMPPR